MHVTNHSIQENIEDFKKLLVHKVAWFIEVHQDFNHESYIKDNPGLLESYYNTTWAKENKISNRRKAFHHFLLYCAIKNFYLNKGSGDPIIKIIDDFSENVNSKSLHSRQNKLECVCLNMTAHEIESYKELVLRIEENTNIQFSKNIDFVIVTNKYIKLDLSVLTRLFKKVVVFNLDVPPEEDLYLRNKNEIKNYLKTHAFPSHGFKSGPNIMFLRTMDLLKYYNTSLLLENDCYFSKDWLERLENYTLYSNGFWISGSIYDGKNPVKANSINLCHINGVALYATGDIAFQAFIKQVDLFIKECAKRSPDLAYDVAIKMMIDFGFDYAKDHKLWSFINRNYTTNRQIFNYSTENDRNLSEKELYIIHNFAVLHKKTSTLTATSLPILSLFASL